MATTLSINPLSATITANTTVSATSFTFTLSGDYASQVPNQEYNSTNKCGYEIVWNNDGSSLSQYIGFSKQISQRKVGFQVTLVNADTNYDYFRNNPSKGFTIRAYRKVTSIVNNQTVEEAQLLATTSATLTVCGIQTTALTWTYSSPVTIDQSKTTTNSTEITISRPNNWTDFNGVTGQRKCRYQILVKNNGSVVNTIYTVYSALTANTNYVTTVDGLSPDTDYSIGVIPIGDGRYYSNSEDVAFATTTTWLYDGSANISTTATTAGTSSDIRFTGLKEKTAYKVTASTSGDGVYYIGSPSTAFTVTTEPYRAVSAVNQTLTFGFNELTAKILSFKCWGNVGSSEYPKRIGNNLPLEDMNVSDAIADTSPNYHFNISFDEMFLGSDNISGVLEYGYQHGDRITGQGINYSASTTIVRQKPIIASAVCTPSSLTYPYSSTTGQIVSITQQNIVMLLTAVPNGFTATTSTTSNGAAITVGPSAQNNGPTSKTGTLYFSACTTTHMFTGSTSLEQDGNEPLTVFWDDDSIVLNFTGETRTVTVENSDSSLEDETIKFTMYSSFTDNYVSYSSWTTTCGSEDLEMDIVFPARPKIELADYSNSIKNWRISICLLKNEQSTRCTTRDFSQMPRKIQFDCPPDRTVLDPEL